MSRQQESGELVLHWVDCYEVWVGDSDNKKLTEITAFTTTETTKWAEKTFAEMIEGDINYWDGTEYSGKGESKLDKFESKR